jgi:cobalt-zinc-cadmium efflux system outer membrane protein
MNLLVQPRQSPPRHRAVLALTLFAATLGGCAVYRPAPLSAESDAVLAQPDLNGAAVAAARMKNPRLTPVSIDLNQPLTPEALGLIAVVENPDLKAARAKAGVARAQAFAAGLLPDPVITLGGDHILSGPDHTDPRLASIALDLNALRERGVTEEAAEDARRQARLDLAWQELQTAGQARLLAARINGLEAAAAINAESHARAEAMLTRVLSAAARGDVKADEVEARRLAAADAADKARQTERDLGAARLDLNKLLGLRPETALRIAAATVPVIDDGAEALFERAKRQRLDLGALWEGYRSQEAGVRKAVMDQFPNLQLTLTRQRDTTSNQLIGPSVNFTLPLWNRNQGGIAVARATREQLAAEYAARVFAARADIAALVDGLDIERRQRAEIAAQVGPLTAIVSATADAARHGDIAQAAADAARQSLADKQLALIGLDQAMAEQTIALELAVGAPLNP